MTDKCHLCYEFVDTYNEPYLRTKKTGFLYHERCVQAKMMDDFISAYERNEIWIKNNKELADKIFNKSD